MHSHHHRHGESSSRTSHASRPKAPGPIIRCNAFKLLEDPQLNPAYKHKLVRVEGVCKDKPSLNINGPPTDPRSSYSRFRTAPDLDLLVPQFVVDNEYVGQPPLREVSVFDLNDNVNKQFLEQMASKYGEVCEVWVQQHPSTHKHLGQGLCVFESPAAARTFHHEYHHRSVMGSVIRCILDPYVAELAYMYGSKTGGASMAVPEHLNKLDEAVLARKRQHITDKSHPADKMECENMIVSGGSPSPSPGHLSPNVAQRLEDEMARVKRDMSAERREGERGRQQQQHRQRSRTPTPTSTHRHKQRSRSPPHSRPGSSNRDRASTRLLPESRLGARTPEAPPPQVPPPGNYMQAGDGASYTCLPTGVARRGPAISHMHPPSILPPSFLNQPDHTIVFNTNIAPPPYSMLGPGPAKGAGVEEEKDREGGKKKKKRRRRDSSDDDGRNSRVVVKEKRSFRYYARSAERKELFEEKRTVTRYRHKKNKEKDRSRESLNRVKAEGIDMESISSSDDDMSSSCESTDEEMKRRVGVAAGKGKKKEKEGKKKGHRWSSSGSSSTEDEKREMKRKIKLHMIDKHTPESKRADSGRVFSAAPSLLSSSSGAGRSAAPAMAEVPPTPPSHITPTPTTPVMHRTQHMTVPPNAPMAVKGVTIPPGVAVFNPFSRPPPFINTSIPPPQLITPKVELRIVDISPPIIEKQSLDDRIASIFGAHAEQKRAAAVAAAINTATQQCAAMASSSQSLSVGVAMGVMGESEDMEVSSSDETVETEQERHSRLLSERNAAIHKAELASQVVTDRTVWSVVNDLDSVLVKDMNKKLEVVAFELLDQQWSRRAAEMQEARMKAARESLRATMAQGQLTPEKSLLSPSGSRSLSQMVAGVGWSAEKTTHRSSFTSPDAVSAALFSSPLNTTHFSIPKLPSVRIMRKPSAPSRGREEEESGWDGESEDASDKAHKSSDDDDDAFSSAVESEGSLQVMRKKKLRKTRTPTPTDKTSSTSSTSETLSSSSDADSDEEDAEKTIVKEWNDEEACVGEASSAVDKAKSTSPMTSSRSSDDSHKKRVPRERRADDPEEEDWSEKMSSEPDGYDSYTEHCYIKERKMQTPVKRAVKTKSATPNKTHTTDTSKDEQILRILEQQTGAAVLNQPRPTAPPLVAPPIEKKAAARSRRPMPKGVWGVMDVVADGGWGVDGRRPTKTWKKRTHQEETLLIHNIQHGLIDAEDELFIREALHRIQESADCPWKKVDVWEDGKKVSKEVVVPYVEQCDREEPRLLAKHVEQRGNRLEQHFEDDDLEGVRPHSTGCARTEGFYRLSTKQKRRIMRRPEGYVDRTEISERDETTVRHQLGLLKEQRSMNRRLLTSMGDTNTEFFKVNQLKYRKKMIKFARSRIHGWGLYALEPIAPDDMIVEYVGQKIRPMVADEREKAYERRGIGSSYLFRIDEEQVIDATKMGNFARFINHSCQPNCYARVVTVDGDKRIVIYSKSLINKGDEITYDYKFPIEDDKIDCLCGAPNCRGFLN